MSLRVENPTLQLHQVVTGEQQVKISAGREQEVGWRGSIRGGEDRGERRGSDDTGQVQKVKRNEEVTSVELIK